MQRINLSTRKKALTARNSRRPFSILSVAAICVVLALGWHYLSLRHQYGQARRTLQQLETRYTALQEQSRNYQQMVEQLKFMETRYSMTEQQLRLANGIKSQRRDWYSIVAAISRQVPKRIWLTDISSSGENLAATASPDVPDSDSPGPKTIVTITGQALDSPAIVHYLKNLQSEKDILSAVDFSEVIRIEADDNTGIPAHFAFVVSCQLK